MNKNLVFCVGNGLMGDDGAGALLVQMMQNAPLEDWDVINGGSTPENALYRVRELTPERVLVVDAADMDLAPGSIRLIRDKSLNDPFLMTTHALPLTYLIDALREFVPRVELLGIQPELVAFGYPISDNVERAVNQVYVDLCSGEASWAWI